MNDSNNEIVGTHPLMHKLHHLVGKVARTDATVLISGESGTGKELVAARLHALSTRSDKPFVAINCGTIPGGLLESEMFGHQKGSFTGAIGQRPGMFQLAHEGTIFLDEIGEMDPLLQVKLLRVLQNREIRPVGADMPFKVDVRVVAATNKNLAKEVEAGRFREDLYYRLQVIPVTMPALRERRSDIPILVEHFLRIHNQTRPFPLTISEEAMVLLWEYDWPGNVRELENTIERLSVLADAPMVKPGDLPGNISAFLPQKKIPRTRLNDDGLDLNAAVTEFENRLIDEALRRTKGNKQAAARLLGLKRTTLVAKLRRNRDDNYEAPASYAY